VCVCVCVCVRVRACVRACACTHEYPCVYVHNWMLLITKWKQIRTSSGRRYLKKSVLIYGPCLLVQIFYC